MSENESVSSSQNGKVTPTTEALLLSRPKQGALGTCLEVDYIQGLCITSPLPPYHPTQQAGGAWRPRLTSTPVVKWSKGTGIQTPFHFTAEVVSQVSKSFFNRFV